MSENEWSADVELDEFTTAIEGGINYWAEIVAYKWDRAKWYAEIIEWGAGSDSTPGRHRIDREVIRRGMQVLADSKSSRFSGVYCGVVRSGFQATEAWWDAVDADTADQVVQAGLFGEVVYG